MGSLCDRDKAKGRHSTGIMPLGIRSVRSSVDSYDLDSRLRGMTDGAEFSHGSRISRFQCVSHLRFRKGLDSCSSIRSRTSFAGMTDGRMVTVLRRGLGIDYG
jgi:hypothetical protein